MTTTSVLIGSEPNLAAQTVSCTVEGDADNITVDAGPYYLQHDDTALSLIATFALELESHTEGPIVSIIITGAGLVRINVSGVASFSISWGSATDLRDLLGFTGNLTGALTYTATNPSPLIWIPRRTEIANPHRLGTTGDPVYDTAVGGSAGPGVPVATQHNVKYDGGLEWRHCAAEVIRTLSGSQNGKWTTFHERVIRRFSRFFLQRECDYQAGSTTAMQQSDGAGGLTDAFSGSAPLTLGPYCWRPPSGPVRYQAPREEEMREVYNRVSLPVTLVDEY